MCARTRCNFSGFTIFLKNKCFFCSTEWPASDRSSPSTSYQACRPKISPALSKKEIKKSADGSQLLQDAVSALINLGYRKPDAEKSVRDVLRRGEKSLEEILKESLRRMSP